MSAPEAKVPMKIEIGAGTKGMDGYVHVDAVALEGVDVVDDGRTLATFGANVADEIYCHWFLEHVAKHEVPDVHNYTAWRDAFHPYLTTLLRKVVAA